MRIILIMCALCASASAQTVVDTCRNGRDQRGFACTTLFNPTPLDAGPRILQGPGDDYDKGWVEFCKPRVVTDQYGVERLIYARKGCEFGRSR